MKKKKPFSYYFGNLLILAALAGFAFIYWPIFVQYVAPGRLSTRDIDSDFSITIPRLRISAPVIEGVDPWDEEDYKKALEKGVAHAKGTSLPGNGGGIYLFAHSSDVPWRVTRYNTIFLRLGDLEKGDLITLQYGGEIYTYQVERSEIVWPSEVAALVSAVESDRLILQTCTPLGTSLKRLLVFASPTQ